MEKIMEMNQTKYRWLAGITGVLAIFLGIWAWMTPLKAVIAMTWIFGIVMIVAGIGTMIAWKDLKTTLDRPAGLMLSGILSLIIGLILLFTHVTSLVMLGTMFAVWFLIDACTWFSFADLSRYPVMVRIASIIGVILGVILLFSPMLSLTALLMTVSVTLIIFGITTLIKAI